ncbi:hypothetical protein [Isoptericola sp. 178]|uniref:hypothetical protein n=1 Tax=Isoptericola sp. 178 TaxID=3064651 RepID=UPI002713EEB9|nr:hypothetical protein [Isoptericola sp. 178]MDO8145055.1 hypothetical protein [Isoptericola sp. 178]
MPRRIFLHVGAPKSGTTSLQSRLLLNERALRRHGLTYPLGPLRDPEIHYRAALDVTGKDHGLDPRTLRDAWPRLRRAVRRSRGDVVVSHEIFSSASEEQARRVLEDLSGTGDEVHVVVTARDLARELASGWQEMVKFGSTRSFAAYMRRARENRLGFMASFDVPRLLTVWGADLPADRLHVVTAPAAGSPDVLWRRFLDALGVPADVAPREAARVNESIGVAQARLLRRLNRELGDDARRGGAASPLIESVVVPGMGSRPAARITIGPHDHPWVVERTERWTRWLRDRGVRVHGDLDDLVPEPPAPRWVDPDRRMPRQVADAAVATVADLLVELQARPPSRVTRARRALRRLRG